MPRAIFLMGPTAAGKTDLAVDLSEHHNCEIISVDSALIYRDMNIGTAKPDSATLKRAPHHLVDIVDPAESYSVAQFRKDALALMQNITLQGKIPLLVGGTMMYYKALVNGMADLPASDPNVRTWLQTQADSTGIVALHQQLQAVDPTSAARLDPTDSQRILRALEVFHISGKTLTAHWQEQQAQPFPYQVLPIGIWPHDRSVLHERIAQRFTQMLAEGFADEVSALMARGDLGLSMSSMRCVGYRQMWQHLNGEYDLPTMQHKAIVATRQLGKRQLTWLRSWPNLQYIDSGQDKLSFTVLQLFDRMPI